MLNYCKIGFLVFLLAACNEEGAKVQVSGTLQSVQPNTNLSVENPPLVGIQGRSLDELEYSINGQATSGPQLSFVLGNVPANQTLVFFTEGSVYDRVVSFPQSTDEKLVLPVLQAATISAIIALAEDELGLTVNTDVLGIVMGILQPPFSDGVVSSSGNVSKVNLLNFNGESEVSMDGPFYFDGQGNLVDSGTCPDAECSYIFFNVPEGNHRFVQLDANDQIVKQTDVVALASSVTFGIE